MRDGWISRTIKLLFSPAHLGVSLAGPRKGPFEIPVSKLALGLLEVQVLLYFQTPNFL